MKRIINGVTYNTDTATAVARSWWEDWEKDNERVESWLYLTRGGAFFLVHHQASEDVPIFEPVAEREDVDKWLTTGEVELFDQSVFQEPPEASAEREPEATLYIRVPRRLKERIEARAEADDLSLNAWVMRCVERCAQEGRADG